TARALREHGLVVQALIGDEFEIDLDVGIGLREGVRHGAYVSLAVGGLRHEKRIDGRFGESMGNEQSSDKDCAKECLTDRFQHLLLPFPMLAGGRYMRCLPGLMSRDPMVPDRGRRPAQSPGR